MRYDRLQMAQNLGEYGGLAGGRSGDLSNGLSNLATDIESALRDPTPKTWLMIAGFCFVLWFLFLRRK